MVSLQDLLFLVRLFFWGKICGFFKRIDLFFFEKKRDLELYQVGVRKNLHKRRSFMKLKTALMGLVRFQKIHDTSQGTACHNTVLYTDFHQKLNQVQKKGDKGCFFQNFVSLLSIKYFFLFSIYESIHAFLRSQCVYEKQGLKKIVFLYIFLESIANT